MSGGGCHEAAAGSGGVQRLTVPAAFPQGRLLQAAAGPPQGLAPAVVPAPRTRAPGPQTARHDRGRRLQLGADHERSEQHRRGERPHHALLLQTGESGGLTRPRPSALRAAEAERRPGSAAGAWRREARPAPTAAEAVRAAAQGGKRTAARGVAVTFAAVFKALTPPLLRSGAQPLRSRRPWN